MGRCALTLVLLTLAVAAACGGSATTATRANSSSNSASASSACYVDYLEGHSSHRVESDITGGFIRALLLRGGYAVLADALVNLTSVAAEMGCLASEGHGLTLLPRQLDATQAWVARAAA